jgi:hypothetical protein
MPAADARVVEPDVVALAAADAEVLPEAVLFSVGDQ